MSVPSSPAVAVQEGRLLMIVDDEPELLQSLVTLFSRHYRVVSASSAEEALKLLQEGCRPQVVLSDNRMPGLTGVEFFAQCVDYLPDVVRVIMTGYTDVKDMVAAINRGHVYMFLTKPCQVPDLLQAMRICFHHHEVQLHNQSLVAEMAAKNEQLRRANEELLDINRKLQAQY